MILGGLFITLYTGVMGGICSTAKTFAKPIKTSSQPSYNTEKEAVSSAEVKPWLLENKQTKKKDRHIFSTLLEGPSRLGPALDSGIGSGLDTGPS